MKAGDVVIIALPQSDGRLKPRPAILIKEVPPFGDWILCPISSKLRHEIPDVDMVINSSHSDFVAMGIKTDSLIRLAKISTIVKSEIKSVIGEVSEDTFKELIRRLTRWLQS